MAVDHYVIFHSWTSRPMQDLTQGVECYGNSVLSLLACLSSTIEGSTLDTQQESNVHLILLCEDGRH
ncbi:hypothetical protein PanWU01x14_351160, partial [Parasponia andersonii]